MYKASDETTRDKWNCLRSREHESFSQIYLRCTDYKLFSHAKQKL